MNKHHYYYPLLYGSRASIHKSRLASQLIKHTIFQPLGLPLRYASGRMDTHLIIFQKSSVASINSFWHVLSDIILQYGHLISSVIPSILPSLLHIAPSTAVCSFPGLSNSSFPNDKWLIDRYSVLECMLMFWWYLLPLPHMLLMLLLMIFHSWNDVCVVRTWDNCVWDIVNCFHFDLLFWYVLFLFYSFL